MVLAIALLVGAGAALAASIVNSKHDLNPDSTGATIKATGTQQNKEICIWCHTPHFASATTPPLWNKAVQATAYTAYGTTVAGTVPGAPAGVSKACLSCHDGVNGINNLINQAGTGGVTAGNNVAFGNTAAGTAVVMTGNALIGTSLANDHPISLVYTETTKASLKLKSTGLTGWIGVTTINGLLVSGNMECSSCHAVHDPVNTLFLRVANTSSALCLGCHAK
jgi:predicted CXXCH cytochrome family protein